MGELNGSRGEPVDLEGLPIAIIAITGARKICCSGERGCCSAGAVFSSSGASSMRHCCLPVLMRARLKGGCGDGVSSLYSLILILAALASRTNHACL